MSWISYVCPLIDLKHDRVYVNLIFNRCDEDQCARRHLQIFLGIKDPDYYEFEGVFFLDI